MKIVSLQFAPCFGDVMRSIVKVEELLKNVKEHDVDLLMLPELALTGDYSNKELMGVTNTNLDAVIVGYNFPSLAAIAPFLERQGEGPSSAWAKNTAIRLQCIVSIGYPETTGSRSNGASSTPVPSHNFNSNITYGPDGRQVSHYRKSFLYMTDVTWCSEGSGFLAGHLPAPVNKRFTLGICMDINPYLFMAPFEEMEFATHAKDSGAEVVAVCMAWTSWTLLPAHVLGGFERDVPDLETLSYWIRRFAPLVKREEKCVLLMGNRCGIEGEIVYTGTSLVARVGGGAVEIWDVLGKGAEKLLRVDTTSVPKYVWDASELQLVPND